MKKVNTMAAILAISAMILIGIVSLPRKPRMVQGDVPDTRVAAPIFRMEMEGRHHALIERYESNVRKLDSLEGNTGGIPHAEREMSQKLLQEARTRRDHTQFALELLGRADTTDPAAWEVLRAAAKDSLDSLEKYLGLMRNGSLRPETGSLRPGASGPTRPALPLEEATRELKEIRRLQIR